jgi:hypothetical protein
MRYDHSRQPPRRHLRLQGSAGTVRPPVLLGQNATAQTSGTRTTSVLRSNAHAATGRLPESAEPLAPLLALSLQSVAEPIYFSSALLATAACLMRGRPTATFHSVASCLFRDRSFSTARFCGSSAAGVSSDTQRFTALTARRRLEPCACFQSAEERWSRKLIPHAKLSDQSLNALEESLTSSFAAVGAIIQVHPSPSSRRPSAH